MAELVEQSLHFVEIKKRRLIRRRFSKIAYDADMRADNLASEVSLFEVVGHPGALRFAGAREEVGVKKADKFFFGALFINFKDLNFLVINGIFFALDKS